MVENALELNGFNVEVNCATGYRGSAKASVCSSNKEEYSIFGCSKIPDNYICVAPSVSKGYLITESELRLNSFSVAVKCTPGYAGVASVQACSGDKELSEYSLTGCTKR